MRQIRNMYLLLEGSGLLARDIGPGLATGTLSANVTWCPYYYPPGVPYGYKGVTIAASESRIVSAAAAGFNSAEGSIEMLVKPSWDYDDGETHFFWSCHGVNNRSFALVKNSDGNTYLYVDNTLQGEIEYHWSANTLYHIVLNWPDNKLYINKVLAQDFADSSLGLGSSTLYIGDHWSDSDSSFEGNIYYFISRDVPLTQAEINDFYAFFVNQYT